MRPLSSSYPNTVKNPTAFVGPYVVSIFLQAVQTGVLLCLHVTFWGQSREGKVTRCLVAFISIIGLFQTFLSVQQLWEVVITDFGDWNAIFSWPPISKLPYLITAFIAVPVQLFLSRRCWLLWGKHWFLLVILGALILGYIGVTLMVTIEFFTLGADTNLKYVAPSEGEFAFTVGPRFAVVLVMPVVLDTVLTSLLLIRLIQLRSNTYTRKFRKILKAVTMITWETAIPPSACAVVNMILYGSGTESNFWFKVFRDILGKLYVISLMITLNSRAYLSELNNKDVTLQPVHSLLPIPVTDRAIRTQPHTGDLSLDASVPIESKHTEATPESDELQPVGR